jgi:hypothetical protein
MCRFGVALLCFATTVFAQERWDLGFGAGYGFYKNVTATNAAGEASVGFKPGIAFGAFAGNEINRWLAGEARYTYRQNDARAKAGGVEAKFDAESHVLNYDFIFHLAPRRAPVRPFLAAGAGVKIYRGTGRETAFQPLNSFVALTRTTQIAPLVSVGGGVKIELNPLLSLRVEARDYASTLPDQVIAPVPGARVSGWLHDIVPMIGLSFQIGR